MAAGLEQELTRLDAALVIAERQGAAVVRAMKELRQQVKTGLLAGLSRRLAQLPEVAVPLTEALAVVAGSFSYDPQAAFADGSYLTELCDAAERAGVVLVEREGRITAFPLLLKLEPAAPGVRVGRRLEREIRPARLAGLLKTAQARTGFSAVGFLDMLFRAARVLSGGDPVGAGTVVGLLEIHHLLTLRPGAASDYPQEAFAVDLLRLDRAPDTRTRQGYRFRLPASTSSKGSGRLTVYDEAGAEHAYVGIAFERVG